MTYDLIQLCEHIAFRIVTLPNETSRGGAVTEDGKGRLLVGESAS